VLAAVRAGLARRGLKTFDAFKAFDVDKDGLLSCGELWGGLAWLGLTLTADDIYAVVRFVDTTGDGRVRFGDFAAAFGAAEGDGPAVVAGEEPEERGDPSEIRPMQIAELYHVRPPPPAPPSRTDWTRLVPPPVLTGHASSRPARTPAAPVPLSTCGRAPADAECSRRVR
jgi:hypothetical protein